jgi:hypothetical protein
MMTGWQQRGNRMSEANGASRQPRRRGIVALATTALIAGVTLTAATGATAKVHLAGNYSGRTSEGHSVTFQITKKGKVVNFAAVVNLGVSFTNYTDPCYGQGMTATVTAPSPIGLTRPKPGYPQGTVFRYGGPGGNPPGNVGLKGFVFRGTNFAGGAAAFDVPTSLGTCRSSAKITYHAKKVG